MPRVFLIISPIIIANNSCSSCVPFPRLRVLLVPTSFLRMTKSTLIIQIGDSLWTKDKIKPRNYNEMMLLQVTRGSIRTCSCATGTELNWQRQSNLSLWHLVSILEVSKVVARFFFFWLRGMFIPLWTIYLKWLHSTTGRISIFSFPLIFIRWYLLT